MPDYTCYCGRGFYIPYKKSKQLVTSMERFCNGNCLLEYIKSKGTNEEFKIDDVVLSDLSEPLEFWDDKLQMFFRSSYESTVGRFLEKHKFRWVYEMLTIKLEGKEYTPDFWLNDYDVFLEVKGLWGLGSKKKLYRAYKAGYNILLLPDYLIRTMRRRA